MDSYNSFSNGASVYEELSPCPPSIVQSNYASVYQVNYKGELQFVYVQYSQQYPSFDELIAASKFFADKKNPDDITSLIVF